LEPDENKGLHASAATRRTEQPAEMRGRFGALFFPKKYSEDLGW
jgi:hypothetical protein